tara:strand:- start:952 stop:1326 length:375 start_codon:yes stop_codon:yes gene_type:complete
MKKGNQGDGGGRPATEFDQDQINLVEKLASVLTKAQLSDYLGISETTFRAVEERQPEVSDAYKKGRSKAIASVAGNLINQAQSGNMTAAIFYLKTQAGWKEQDTTNITAESINKIQIIRATKPD